MGIGFWSRKAAAAAGCVWVGLTLAGAPAQAQSTSISAPAAASSPNLAPGFSHRPAASTLLVVPPDLELFSISAGGVTDTLAATAHVTPRHLARLFQQHAGLSPRDYVAHVRLQLALAARQQGASAAGASAAGGFRSERQWRRTRARQARVA